MHISKYLTRQRQKFRVTTTQPFLVSESSAVESCVFCCYYVIYLPWHLCILNSGLWQANSMRTNVLCNFILFNARIKAHTAIYRILFFFNFETVQRRKHSHIYMHTPSSYWKLQWTKPKTGLDDDIVEVIIYSLYRHLVVDVGIQNTTFSLKIKVLHSASYFSLQKTCGFVTLKNILGEKKKVISKSFQ